jgi:hypothetical protein
MKEVKGTLKSRTSYQGSPHPSPIPSYLVKAAGKARKKEKRSAGKKERPPILVSMRKVSDECLVNPEEPGIEKIPYEKELKCTEPTSSIIPTFMPETTRKIVNTEESNSHMTHAHFT